MTRKSLPARTIDLRGQTFGRWTVREYFGSGANSALWSCVCECGNVGNISSQSLRDGRSRSCGCLSSELLSERASHRDWTSKEYRVWCGMKSRCSNRNIPSFSRYGGRGISVCDRWLNSYEDFLSDMGRCPKGFSLDRIDPNGNYEPENCRWASSTTQANNTRRNICLTIDGVTMTIAQWADRTGQKRERLYYRKRRGWPDHEVLYGR